MYTFSAMKESGVSKQSNGYLRQQCGMHRLKQKIQTKKRIIRILIDYTNS